MKNTKGITLIALVITIIVMLILVAVTVAVVMNGGLFTKAQTATTGTDKKSDQEQLTSAAVGALDSDANFNIRDMTLPEGAKWISEKNGVDIASQNEPNINGNWVKTSNGNQFYIDNKGNVLDDETQQYTIAFPMTVQVGENAYATWTNDSTGGKITVTGTGATYDFNAEGGLETGETAIAEFLEEIELEGMLPMGIIEYAFGIFGDATPEQIVASPNVANSGATPEELQMFESILSSINKITTIEFGEGITKIGNDFIHNSSSINTLILPTTLVEIAHGAMCETIVTNPIYVPIGIQKIGVDPVNEGATFNMATLEKDKDNIIIETREGRYSFEGTYTVNWGVTQ